MRRFAGGAAGGSGGGGGGGGSIVSVFSRTDAAIVAQAGDYAAGLITNDSSVSGATVKLALNTLLTAIGALATVATTGAWADLSGVPTYATVATTGAYADLSGKPALAAVATTGAYASLTGTPTLATVATTGAYADLSGKPTLATVATSGAYADLSGKPTLGTSAALNVAASGNAASGEVVKGNDTRLTNVASFNLRTGAVAAAASDYLASQVLNDSSVSGSFVSGALNTLLSTINALVTGVSSFNLRTGAITPATGDYAALQITNDSSVAGTGVKGALNTLLSTINALVTGVSSFNTRVGAIAPTTGDYAALQITNDSSVTGTGVKGALNTLLSTIGALVTGVSSFNSRGGAIAPTAGDYTASMITNNSSTVTGTGVSGALDQLESEIGTIKAWTTVNHSMSPYTILATDHALLVDSSAGVVTTILPNPATRKRELLWKDSTGSFGANALTIQRFGSENIENVAQDYVVEGYGSTVRLGADGTNWWTTV